jgi:hypothetical protein
MSTPPQNPEKVSLELVLPPELTSKRSTKKSEEPTKKDLRRWARWRQRASEEDIARDEHTSTLKVRESIQKVLAYQQTNSIEIVTPRVHEVILKHIATVDQIITDLASATRTRTITEKDANGAEIKRDVVEIDYRTRRSAIEALSELRDMVASKETKTSVNFGTQIQAGSLTIGSRSFEDRVRKKREEHGLRNTEPDPAEAAEEVEDAEFEDLENEDDPETNGVDNENPSA